MAESGKGGKPARGPRDGPNNNNRDAADRGADGAAKRRMPRRDKDFIEGPDRNARDAQLKELDGKIAECKAVIEGVKLKLDQLSEDKKKRQEERGGDEDVAELKRLQEESRKILAERKLRIEELKKNGELRKKNKAELDKMRDTIKNAGNATSLEQVDQKVQKLEYYLSTTGLSLKEEKAVIADIKNLNNSKKALGEVFALENKRKELKENGDKLSAILNESKKQLDTAKDAENKQFKKVQDKRKPQGERVDYKALIESRNKAREEMDKHYKEIRKIRDAFRKEEDEFRKVLEVKKKERKEREQKEREAYLEEQRFRKLQEEEENAESMHADKFASIDQIKFVLNKIQKDGEVKPQEEAKEIDMSSLAKEGQTLIGKHAKQMDDDIFGTKKAGKKKGGPKKSNKKKAPGLTFDLNILHEFSSLGLSAPLTVEEIPETFKKLDAKRVELEEDKKKKHEERKAKIAAHEAEKAAAGEADASPAAEDAQKENTEAVKNAEEAPAAAVEATA